MQGTCAGAALGVLGFSSVRAAQNEPKKKIKALLVTGGGYHDYDAQKSILTDGVAELIDIDWTIWHNEKADETKAALSEKGWADPYDIIVYNICHANESDEDYINSVIDVHKAGKPMVAIHCTMHSYHWKTAGGKRSKNDKEWNKLLGVASVTHGKQGPAISVKKTEVKHPAYPTALEEWQTPKGELYNIKKLYPSATVLANGNNGKDDEPVIWVNKFGKANVFGTTIGHHNETVKAKEFQQVIADGIVWAVAASQNA